MSNVLTLYNTLTGKKDPFDLPKDHLVTMYTCGPTVYNYAHIGNLRSYVFADTLRRTLEYNGYKVKQVMNITDVGHLTSDADDGDDKMVKALKREGKPFTFEAMQEIARKYETAFKEDLRALNIELPKDMPRASENIPEDIEIVRKLLEKRVAYKTSDGIYFDISKFPEYGTRGGFKLGDLKDGARIAVNAEKKNPRDFSLWKFSTTELGWDFPPYGKGFPGWHIECSAMSRKYLGQPFDIHTGGIDHIPTHHQNEIAQSEVAYDAPLANYWLHNEHLVVPSGKMAKSEGNIQTLDSLGLKYIFFEKGVIPLAYRLWLLTAHYRQKIEFSIEAVLGSQTFYKRILTQVNWVLQTGKPNENYKKDFLRALNDDLDTPRVIALAAKVLNDETLGQADKKATLGEFDKVLGLNFQEMARKLKVVPIYVQELSKQREAARRAKDFKKSDELRDQIQKEGFEVMDTDSGPIIRKR